MRRVLASRRSDAQDTKLFSLRRPCAAGNWRNCRAMAVYGGLWQVSKFVWAAGKLGMLSAQTSMLSVFIDSPTPISNCIELLGTCQSLPYSSRRPCFPIGDPPAVVYRPCQEQTNVSRCYAFGGSKIGILNRSLLEAATGPASMKPPAQQRARSAKGFVENVVLKLFAYCNRALGSN